jgi:hypothetical protein
MQHTSPESSSTLLDSLALPVSSYVPLVKPLTDPLFIPAHQNVPLAATRIYEMAFFTGFGTSALIYYVLNRIWPSPGAFQKWEEIDESEFAERQEEDADKKPKESEEGSEDEKEKSAESDGPDAKVRQV